MIKDPDLTYIESRSNLRIKENTPVSWISSGNRLEGRGLIRNISASGMLIETDKVLNPGDQGIFSFASLSERTDFIPQKGRLVWHKKKRFSKKNSLCGIEFIDGNENVMANLRKRIQTGTIRLTKIRKIRIVVDVALFTAVLTLMAYVIWTAANIYSQTSKTNQNMVVLSDQQTVLISNYVKLYRQSESRLIKTEKLYQESEVMLASVRKDLDTTKGVLSETEDMLSKTRSELGEMQALNERTKSDFALAKTNFEKTITSLQEKSAQLTEEISGLNKKIAFYEGNVKDLAEGRALLKLYREKMRLVKSKISSFRNEARDVRNAALRERDRIRSIIGNNGYFVKDGQTVNVDMQKFKAGVLAPSMKAKKVDIDVQFIK